MLDVEPKNPPRGNVNVGFSPIALRWKGKDNFVVAVSAHPPFHNDAFDTAFIATIEHTKDLSIVLKEMSRVSKRKIIVRYFQKSSSGARTPGHISFLDEAWFVRVVADLGFGSV
jgi:ubiquinone/menaquinone biosynthesis C-methylase UbiE